MAASSPSQLLNPFRSMCRPCRHGASRAQPRALFQQPARSRKTFSTTSPHPDELQTYVDSESASGYGTTQITAAPPFDRTYTEASSANQPARIIPASPSYFTASPKFYDSILLLRSLLREYESLPTLPSDQALPATWLRFHDYRSRLGEPITTSKYSKVVLLLTRLNKIHPKLQTEKLQKVMDSFRRPDLSALGKPAPRTLDQDGRGHGMGRRKESTARVQLVEGTGEVMINGRSVLQAFPRLHDRESALWALKVTGRMDKYNVFAIVSGGGVTGQAESITLALARALMVHEPALKPTLRKAGCVTSDARRVERKKTGRVKARKRPTWVKR